MDYKEKITSFYMYYIINNKIGKHSYIESPQLYKSYNILVVVLGMGFEKVVWVVFTTSVIYY